MTWQKRLRTLVVCAVLEGAALVGVPMRPEQVQDLMRSLNSQTNVRTAPDDVDRGDKDSTELR